MFAKLMDMLTSKLLRTPGCLLPLVLQVVSLAVAQAPAKDPIAQACGPKDVKFEANLAAPGNIQPAPAAGKALIVFIEDFRIDRPGHHCLKCDVPVALGVDGRWVAVDKGFSHSSVVVDAGQHHLCARVRNDDKDTPAMVNLNARAGATYFLIAIPQYEYDYYVERFNVADPDEGAFLTSISKTSSMVQH